MCLFLKMALSIQIKRLIRTEARGDMLRINNERGHIHTTCTVHAQKIDLHMETKTHFKINIHRGNRNE